MIGWMRERLYMCRHQISGREGQACELRAAVEANASWKLGSNRRSFQTTILIVFNKATKFRIHDVVKQSEHESRSDLSASRETFHCTDEYFQCYGVLCYLNIAIYSESETKFSQLLLDDYAMVAAPYVVK